MMKFKTSLLALALATGTTTASAVTDAEFNELKAQFEQMAEAIEAATTSSSDTTIGGYGELHYNNFGSDGKEIDFHRFVLFINHEFTDKIRLFTEFELEHALAGEGKPGEVELEQAYIQFDLDDSSTLNAGVFLVPVGILNETHEPPTFYGVERNPVEARIIPTTWWEAGVMYSKNTDAGFSFDIAVHSGLKADIDDDDDTVTDQVPIRGARQKVAEADAENLAATARVKYTGIAGLELAGTLHIQSDISQDDTDDVDGATLIETHAIWNSGPFGATVMYAMWDIDGTGASNIGADEQEGLVLEASYRVHEQFGVFARQSTWDNEAGSSADTEKSQTNYGVNYWPHEDVVIKFDIQSQDANAGNKDGFNLGVGYQF